jgi:hypothetical protein
MIQREDFSKEKRALKTVNTQTDFVVIGGGMSGICTAISAARSGIKVTLVQDRPVLGGNASSEVRLWILGATSHMGNNNRWAREGGVINEILLENLYRNKEGNPVIFDSVLLEKVKSEPNITLLLNTCVYDIEKKQENKISKVFAFCAQNETFYELSAPLFCDASGDGSIAYRAGASYRMGAEEESEYGEKFIREVNGYGDLLGHSMYFYSKDAGKPVKFIPPSYALKDITQIPRFADINPGEHGCKFWWLEYGGRKDTIHDTEDIKWELWSVVYGVWDYIKNSGAFLGTENLILEWVCTIPGKRESRRFEGLYTLKQQDIINQHHFEDAVAFGGWAIDIHPSDGVYSAQNGCTQYHSKGIYEIPYRCYVSKDIQNLFYAGRNMSASHVAHGSSRVMATSAFGGQAVGVAAALCIENQCNPADLLNNGRIGELQNRLNLAGQSIPSTAIDVKDNLAGSAQITASSSLKLDEIPFDGTWYSLDFSAAQLLPVIKNTPYQFEIEADALSATDLQVEWRYAEKPDNYTPDLTAEQIILPLKKGKQRVTVSFTKTIPENQYGFVIFLKNDQVKLRMSNERYTGILSAFNKFNHAVNNRGKQAPPPDLGIDSFEFWCPDRRPEGQNIAMKIRPAIEAFRAENVINGWIRPTRSANAWVASPKDKNPSITLKWEKIQAVKKIILYFDTDYDHPLESVQMGHPENTIPFCVGDYTVRDENDRILYQQKGNHETIQTIVFADETRVEQIKIELEHPSGEIPAALFQIVVE